MGKVKQTGMKGLVKKLYDKDKLSDRLSSKYESVGLSISDDTEEVFCTAFDIFDEVCKMVGQDHDDIKDDFLFLPFADFWNKWGEAISNGG